MWPSGSVWSVVGLSMHMALILAGNHHRHQRATKQNTNGQGCLLWGLTSEGLLGLCSEFWLARIEFTFMASWWRDFLVSEKSCVGVCGLPCEGWSWDRVFQSGWGSIWNSPKRFFGMMDSLIVRLLCRFFCFFFGWGMCSVAVWFVAGRQACRRGFRHRRLVRVGV